MTLTFRPEKSWDRFRAALSSRDQEYLHAVLSSASFSPSHLGATGMMRLHLPQDGPSTEHIYLADNPMLVVWLMAPPGTSEHKLCTLMCGGCLAAARASWGDGDLFGFNRRFLAGLVGVDLGEVPEDAPGLRAFVRQHPILQVYAEAEGVDPGGGLLLRAFREYSMVRLFDSHAPPLDTDAVMETAASVVAGVKMALGRDPVGGENTFWRIFP
jgi:hypothetical protein